MRVVSDAFLAAVRTAHRVVTEVDVLFNRQVVAEGLAVSDGRVTYDRAASALARCDVTFAEPQRFPTGPGDILSPYGYELRIRRGVRYADAVPFVSAPYLLTDDGQILLTDGGLPLLTDEGVATDPVEATTETVSLGVFPIQRSEVDGVALVTSVSGIDRSQLVRDARLEDDYQVAAGTNYGDAIAALVSAGVPGLEYAFTSTSFTTPLLTFEAQADRWEAAQSMARSIGCELFFNGDGALVLRPEPNVATAIPVWDVDEGDDGVLVSATIRLDRTPAYNRVIAFSANASNGEVFRGVATDEDPSSPTYYFGPFGRKPRFFGSPLIGSNDQAAAAAAGILAGNIGVARAVDFSAVSNPALEVGDAVLIRRAALDLDEVHLLDVLSIGLAAEDAMLGASRARQEGA